MADDYFDPFGDDDFDSLVSSFFGRGRRRALRTEIEDEDEGYDFIENGKEVFLILEFPGYSEQDVSVNVKDRIIEVRAKKSDLDNVQEYLGSRLRHGMVISRKLPDFVSTKEFGYTFKNGILEVRFRRK